MDRRGSVTSESSRRRCINCSLVIPRNTLIHTVDSVHDNLREVLNSWVTPTLVNPLNNSFGPIKFFWLPVFLLWKSRIIVDGSVNFGTTEQNNYAIMGTAWTPYSSDCNTMKTKSKKFL